MTTDTISDILAEMASNLEKNLSKSDFKRIGPYAEEIASRHSSRLAWLESMAKNEKIEKHQYERALLAERDIYQIELESLAKLSKYKAKKIARIMSDTLRSSIFGAVDILL
ncbi:MAG: hypothetical protein ACK5MG_04875 [Bacteroidales bacterium]